MHTLKEINAAIRRVSASYGKINAFVQEVAVACIEHCQAHNDCTPALRLVQAMPASSRRGLLVLFFARFSPIGMNVAQGKCGLHKAGSKAYNDFNIEGARANNWYESPEAAKEDLPDTTLETARSVVLGTANRLQKRLDAGEVAANDVEPVTALIGQLRALSRAA